MTESVCVCVPCPSSPVRVKTIRGGHASLLCLNLQPSLTTSWTFTIELKYQLLFTDTTQKYTSAHEKNIVPACNVNKCQQVSDIKKETRQNSQQLAQPGRALCRANCPNQFVGVFFYRHSVLSYSSKTVQFTSFNVQGKYGQRSLCLTSLCAFAWLLVRKFDHSTSTGTKTTKLRSSWPPDQTHWTIGRHVASRVSKVPFGSPGSKFSTRVFKFPAPDLVFPHTS